MKSDLPQHCRGFRVLLVAVGALSIWPLAAHAGPISMVASASVVHDGGFGGPANHFGPFNLPFDANPPVTITSSIQGAAPNVSNLAVGGSKYFDPNLAVVVLANGSYLSQFAPNHNQAFGPATATVDIAALTRVDDWSNIDGFYSFPNVHGNVGGGGFVAAQIDVHFHEFVRQFYNLYSSSGQFISSGYRDADIAVDIPLTGHYQISTPGPFLTSVFASTHLLDVSLSARNLAGDLLTDVLARQLAFFNAASTGYESEQQTDIGAFISFNGELVVTALDPDGETGISFDSFDTHVRQVPEPSTLGTYLLGFAITVGLRFASGSKKGTGPFKKSPAALGVSCESENGRDSHA